MTTKLPRIAVIIASTRSTRFADHVAAWVEQELTARGDLELDVIDIRDVALPYYDLPTPPAVARRAYDDTSVRELGERIDAEDGYLIITNEYNHGYSAALKNVLDHYFAELEHKPVAFVGYGNVGGSRAIEQLRQVIVELSMVSVRESVHILGPQFAPIREGGDAASESLATLQPRLHAMIDHLLWWTAALTTARNNDRKDDHA